MRIVGGTFKGHRIATPRGFNTRPTSSQVRESIFNILNHVDWAPDLIGALAADIFAGSGALGLEALSRGARFCLFVETEAKARAAIRENIETMNLTGVTRLHHHDANRLRIEPENLRGPFTHVFLDPPYYRNIGRPQILKKLNARALLASNAVIIFQMANNEEPDLRGFAVHDTRIWGATKVAFLSKRH